MYAIIVIILILILVEVSALPSFRRGLQESESTSSTSFDADAAAAAARDSVSGGGGVVVSKKNAKRSVSKAEKLKKLVSQLDHIPIPNSFKKEDWCGEHTKNGKAIFAAAIDSNAEEVRIFIKTLRATNYNGDIVLAVNRKLVTSAPNALKLLKDNNVIVYVPDLDCEFPLGNKVENVWRHMTLCKVSDRDENGQKGIKFVGRFNINLLRVYFYFWWSKMYTDKATIMLSDFRDVLFQSDPFIYKRKDSKIALALSNNMLVFQEGFPNKMIYRCGFNSGWITSCFGENVFQKIGQNMVSCSGVSIGPRDAMLAYSFLMIQLINPKNRYGKTLLSNLNQTIDYMTYSTDQEVIEAEAQLHAGNKQCISIGTDQGFHNFLIYSGMLEKLVNIKSYPQGEGPVNTLGALAGGKMSILKLNLTTWGILKGNPGHKKFYNWNGDPSPVVHQYDRFQNDPELVQIDGDWRSEVEVVRNLD